MYITIAERKDVSASVYWDITGVACTIKITL